MRTSTLLYLLLLFLAASCQTLKNSSKYGFTEGYYKGYYKDQKPAGVVYVFPDEDSIKVYNAASLAGRQADSVKSLTDVFPYVRKNGQTLPYHFDRHSFDIDVLSILVKYRPFVNGFPNQFNTDILNGAVFIGYRTDLYKVTYRPTPFNTFKRQITHYGFSFGGFAGLGATRIDEFVTRNAVAIQYDGVVAPTGLAAIIAIDKLSFGLNAGIDHLLDANHSYWIYQGKPWVGLSVGLNLN